jgi:hypothetical protein
MAFSASENRRPQPTPSAFAVLLIGAVGLMGCARHLDRFWPDTENGLLAFTEPRVLAGDQERLVFLEPTGDPGEYTAIRRLSHTLLVDDRAVVSVAVPVDGEYTFGGGWIFGGRKYVGRHGVAGDVLARDSSRPDVVAVTTDAFGNLELHALAPGASVVTLSATMSRRYANRPDDAEIFTDTVTFVVED